MLNLTEIKTLKIYKLEKGNKVYRLGIRFSSSSSI